MKRELRIFTTLEDETTLATLAGPSRFIKNSRFQWFSGANQSGVQLLRCRHTESSITIGRLAIATSHRDLDSKKSEELFKLLEEHVKTTYTNSVYIRRLDRPNTAGRRIKDVWVGPGAQLAAIETGVILTQKAGGPIVFELAKESINGPHL